MAPASASPSATPLPTPRLAPVTTATFPLRLGISPMFDPAPKAGRVGEVRRLHIHARSSRDPLDLRDCITGCHPILAARFDCQNVGVENIPFQSVSGLH